jgi:nitrogen regulatory protein P-II 1
MKRIEAVITPRTLDTFKAAARRLGISEFELVEVYRLGSNATEGGKGIYQGCEYRTDLSPRLRVEFVMFDDEVQATVHRLLEFVHPESIGIQTGPGSSNNFVGTRSVEEFAAIRSENDHARSDESRACSRSGVRTQRYTPPSNCDPLRSDTALTAL